MDGEEFKIKLEEKLAEILPQVVHEKGQDVLKAYSKMVVELSTFEYGLELLHMFKQYSLADYVVLRQIDELFNKLKNLDLTENTLLKSEIMANFDAFEKLAPIIKMPKKLLNPDGFVELVNYSVLEVKHQVSYRQFKELISLLERWVEPYKEVNELRRTCSANQYRLPKEFGKEIPGLKIFEKYKSVLDVQV